MTNTYNKLPLISIIIPIYNGSSYIDRGMESLTKQTYSNLEILLIDDGSTDNSLDKCQEWAAKDNRVIVLSQQNKGAGAARNLGLKNATGDFIGFMDADDTIEPTMYETLLSMIEKENADLSIIASRIIEQSTRHTKILAYPDTYLVMNSAQAFKYVNLHGYFGIAPWSRLYKASMFRDQNLAFPENVKNGEDYIFTYKVLEVADTIVFSSVPLYNYWQNADSLSRNYTKVTDEPVRAAKAMVEIVKQKYPESLPFAYYGYLRNAFMAYHAFLLAGNPNRKTLSKSIKQVIRAHWKDLIHTVKISRAEQIQYELFNRFTPLYNIVYIIFSHIKKETY